MIRAVLILRPQPGADETAERARARGFEPVVAPLFTIESIDWAAPPGPFDAVLFTSANAPRHGGAGLVPLIHLPCYTVGEATARAADEAGFRDIRIGPSDGAAAVAMMAADGVTRALHPGALEPMPLAGAGVDLAEVAVYAARPLARLPDLVIPAINAGAVTLLHSPRAAATLGGLIGERRAETRLAAISAAAADAAGEGWASLTVAAEPRDAALLDAAETLAGVARPVPVVAPPPAPVPAPTTARRQGSWLGLLLLLLLAFLLGIAALLWALTRWEGASEVLGLRPEPTVIAAPLPLPASPDRVTGVVSQGESGTLVIDPDVARRVAMLEQRIGELDLDARAAVGNADRAEGLLVAFAARRALDRGVGLGYLDGLLRSRFGQSQPQAVGTIIGAAQTPVTLQALQEALATVGPQLTGAAPDQNMWDAFQTEVANLIIIRRSGTLSSDPRERLRRAVARLEAGQVEIALAEVLRLPGRENGREWVDAAQRYVAARHALDRIETAALLEPRLPQPSAQGESVPPIEP